MLRLRSVSQRWLYVLYTQLPLGIAERLAVVVERNLTCTNVQFTLEWLPSCHEEHRVLGLYPAHHLRGIQSICSLS